MSIQQWKKNGVDQGAIFAEGTPEGVVLQVQPDDDFYAGTLDQWAACELMLHFYSLLRKSPGDKPPGALLLMVREICKMRDDGDRVLGFVEICAVLGVNFSVEAARYDLNGKRLAPDEHHSMCSHDTRRGCNCGVDAVEVPS